MNLYPTGIYVKYGFDGMCSRRVAYRWHKLPWSMSRKVFR